MATQEKAYLQYLQSALQGWYHIMRMRMVRPDGLTCQKKQFCFFFFSSSIFQHTPTPMLFKVYI